MKKIITLLFVFTSLFFFISCNKQTETSPQDLLAAAIMEDAEVVYDGQPHNLVVENAPEGTKITYNKTDLVEPGHYQIVAMLNYMDASTTKTAYLKIKKLDSVFEIDNEQEFWIYDNDGFVPSYTLNNDEQKLEITYFNSKGEIIEANSIYVPGTYEAEAYAKESNHYNKSEVKKFTLTTYYSSFDITYDDSYISYDGSEHDVTLSGTLPEGYTVTYEDNSGTDVGNYFATAYIKDSSGAIVEQHRATLTIDNPHNEQFELYLDDFLVEYFEGDLLSVNIFFENPADYGLEHYDATWYTYTRDTDNDYSEIVQEFEDYIRELHKFEYDKLNQRQKLAYNNIDNFLNEYYQYYQIEDADFKKIVYVDQFGGYVADFGTYMEAYTLRSEQEVIDLVDFVESTLTAFPSYVLFVEDKATKGYALSDYTLNEMIKYLDDVLKEHNPEEEKFYYLQNVLCTHIDNVDFLSSEQKENYKNTITEAFAECFIPGVEALKEGLVACKGKLEGEEGYWASYEDGKDLYLLELESLLGIDDLDIEGYITEVDKALNSTVKDVTTTQTKLINQYNITSYPELEDLIASVTIFDGTPEEMLEFLYEFAKTIVPELSYKPNITVKEMDEASAKVSNAVAYYMKSAVDNFENEYITLNPIKLGDSNDVLGTLAHEGYPGHLYAYCNSKKLDLHELSVIMTSTAHGEGWATYVELKLYEYALRNAKTIKEKDVYNYLIANHKSGYMLETRIDLGIHIEGWKEKEIADFLDNLGYSSSYATDLFRQMIEMPTTYNAYGYGKYYFMKLHNNAKQVLGNFYNEVEFNEMLLSKGWTNLGELKNTYDEYMVKACHRYGIQMS